MLVLASCLFYFYYNAGRFSNTYEELNKNIEGINKKAVEHNDTFHNNTMKADTMSKVIF